MSGHNFDYNGEVHIDHWHVICTRCGVMGATDEGPEREGNEVKQEAA